MVSNILFQTKQVGKNNYHTISIEVFMCLFQLRSYTVYNAVATGQKKGGETAVKPRTQLQRRHVFGAHSFLYHCYIPDYAYHHQRTFLGLVTLTSELDLDMFSPDLHTEIKTCKSVRLARIVRRTDTQTDTQTDNAKTITPSADVGCKNHTV